MGEIAEMFLDGTMCQECGAFIDDGNQGPGYPVTCEGCKTENSKTKKGGSKMGNTFYRKFKVEGMFVGKRREHAQKYVKRGSNFDLTREPENPYDRNAILVELPVRGGQYKIDLGYLPKEIAAEVAPLMDAGTQFKATFRTNIINDKTGKLIHLYLNLIRLN